MALTWKSRNEGCAPSCTAGEPCTLALQLEIAKGLQSTHDIGPMILDHTW